MTTGSDSGSALPAASHQHAAAAAGPEPARDSTTPHFRRARPRQRQNVMRFSDEA